MMSVRKKASLKILLIVLVVLVKLDVLSARLQRMFARDVMLAIH